jgi:hypothetical protein
MEVFFRSPSKAERDNESAVSSNLEYSLRLLGHSAREPWLGSLVDCRCRRHENRPVVTYEKKRYNQPCSSVVKNEEERSRSNQTFGQSSLHIAFRHSDSRRLCPSLVSTSVRITRGDSIVSITRLLILALGALLDRMIPIQECDTAKNNCFVFGERIELQLGNTAPKVSSLPCMQSLSSVPRIPRIHLHDSFDGESCTGEVVVRCLDVVGEPAGHPSASNHFCGPNLLSHLDVYAGEITTP